MAVTLEADALVTMCPMCQANLDTRQADLSKAGGRVYNMPIFYLTELIGVAFQDPRARSWLAKHMVPGDTLLARKGLI